MTTPTDLGFLIYLPQYLPVAGKLVDDLKRMNVRWVSYKVSDGGVIYNSGTGYQVDALRAAGISVGGWSYVYPNPTGGMKYQAARISERIKTLKLDHLMLDVEKEWKIQGLRSHADALLKGIDVPEGYPLGFCSYRYPKWHPPIDYAQWLGHPKIKFNAPQVYWEQAHDPARQTIASYTDYKRYPAKPFFPIGSSYGRGKWIPTVADLREFLGCCAGMNFSAFGFYSLDWIYRNNRQDFIDAIAEWKKPIPVTTPSRIWANASSNLYSDDKGKMFGNVSWGAELDVLDEIGDYYQVKTFIRKEDTREL